MTTTLDGRGGPSLAALWLGGALLAGTAGLGHAANGSLNLFTQSEGLHAIGVPELAQRTGYAERDLGTWLSAGQFALASGGKPRAWRYDAATRTLYFAAERFDSEHTDRNVYRLYRNPNGANARPMAMATGPGPEPGTPGAFRETLVLEQDNAYAPWALRDPNGRYWFWDYVYAGTGQATLTVPLDLPGVAPVAGQGRLRIELRGSSDLVPGNDHRVSATLNGGPAVAATFDAFNAKTLSLPFDQGVLAATGNRVQLASLLLPGVTQSLQRLDRIVAEYWRKSRARDGQLWLRQVGPGSVTVGGLTGTDIAVIENPAGEGARWREDLTIAADPAGGYRVSFLADAAADYLVANRSAAAAPEAEVDDPATLAATTNRAEYLIVAPKRTMQGAAEALAAYRGGAPRAMIVWEQDIYDQFSARRTDPQAIAKFLKATLAWEQVPTTVTFLGRGTLNHKGRPAHYPGESQLPVAMASGPWGLFPSDNRYCDTDGDGVPEFACGRIPAEDGEEALAYLDKLIAFETASRDGWGERAIGVADNLDPAAGDFAGDATAGEQSLAALGYAVDARHFESGADIVAFRDGLRASLQQGAAFLGYWGHGATTTLGDEDFLPLATVEALSNAPRLPIVAGLTCETGGNAYPGYRALSAALVGNPTGGAIGALMPTGLSMHPSAAKLGNHVIETLAGQRLPLGEAAREAKASAAADGVPVWELDLFDVMGEPQLRLP